jgi:DNA repair protein SbcD/Mre11
MARPFCFVHAADLHLDTPFEGIAKPAPRVAEALQQASLQAWDALVQLTLDEKAAFLLLAGDIYDGEERGVRAQLRFLRGLRMLADARIPVCIVHGNHDPLHGRRGWSAVRDWPEGVTVFEAGEVGSVPVAFDETLLATVHGISYAQRDTAENLARRFTRSGDAKIQIGLLHANVGGQKGHAAYAPCTLTDLEQTGLDYWALGHVHKSTTLRERSPWVVYPGDTQGRSPKASETGEKGALVVRCDDGKVRRTEFRPVDTVRFVACKVPVDDAADLATVHDLVVRALDETREQHQGRGLLARVMLTGRTPLSTALKRQGVVDELAQTLREGIDGAEPFVWLEALHDHTRAAIDRAAVLEAGDFRAELVAAFERLSLAEAAPDDFVAGAAASLDRGDLRRVVRELDPEPAAELLDEALELALDRLSAEEEA